MNIEKYSLQADDSFTYFEFLSTGSNGMIPKIIEFQTTSVPDFYNLAFGDKHRETGDIDDLAVSNNGDTQKVLATVVNAVYAFFDKHPDAIVYATGSTPTRTRLYKMGITKFYNEIQSDFYLYGRSGNHLYEFDSHAEYEAFVAKRKSITLRI